MSVMGDLANRKVEEFASILDRHEHFVKFCKI